MRRNVKTCNIIKVVYFSLKAGYALKIMCLYRWYLFIHLIYLKMVDSERMSPRHLGNIKLLVEFFWIGNISFIVLIHKFQSYQWKCFETFGLKMLFHIEIYLLICHTSFSLGNFYFISFRAPYVFVLPRAHNISVESLKASEGCPFSGSLFVTFGAPYRNSVSNF